jgi:hypothetical protein
MFANIFFEEANKYHVFEGLRFHKIKIGWMGCCGWVKKGGVVGGTYLYMYIFSKFELKTFLCFPESIHQF